MSAAVCAFPTLRDAVDCVIAVSQHGSRSRASSSSTRCSSTRSTGTTTSTTPSRRRCSSSSTARRPRSPRRPTETETIAAEHGGRASSGPTDEAERRRLWHARHRAYDATRALRPGTSALTTDACVPVSALADVHPRDAGRPRRARPDRRRSSATSATATSTSTLLIDPDDPADVAARHGVPRPRRAPRARRAAARAPASTASATARRRYLELEHGAGGVRLMRAIKHALDPDDIFNPGKVAG